MSSPTSGSGSGIDIISSFLTRTTSSPYALYLSIGLSGISYFFWGNVSAQFLGAMVFPIYPIERKNIGIGGIDIDTIQAVEIWGWAYARGAKHMAPSGTLSGLAILAAAFQIPPHQLETTPSLRTYLILLSSLILSTGLWTLVFMLPTNNALLALRNKITKARAASASPLLTAAQEREAETLMQRWKHFHYFRVAVGAMAWIGVLAVYTATV